MGVVEIFQDAASTEVLQNRIMIARRAASRQEEELLQKSQALFSGALAVHSPTTTAIQVKNFRQDASHFKLSFLTIVERR